MIVFVGCSINEDISAADAFVSGAFVGWVGCGIFVGRGIFVGSGVVNDACGGSAFVGAAFLVFEGCEFSAAALFARMPEACGRYECWYILCCAAVTVCLLTVALEGLTGGTERGSGRRVWEAVAEP